MWDRERGWECEIAACGGRGEHIGRRGVWWFLCGGKPAFRLRPGSCFVALGGLLLLLEPVCQLAECPQVSAGESVGQCCAYRAAQQLGGLRTAFLGDRTGSRTGLGMVCGWVPLGQTPRPGV